MRLGAPAPARLRPVRSQGWRNTAAACWVFAGLALCGQAAQAQSTSSGTSDFDLGPLSGGKWIESRSPVDSRPSGAVWIGDGLLRAGYFEWRNRLWTRSGVRISGNASPSIQWGSHGGESNSVGEFLLLVDWEVWRGDKTSGRLITAFAHDQTIGGLTTRRFADNQGIVSTPNDLDFGSDRSFTTLGLFHWEQETRTGPDSGFGFRAGQMFAPSYFATTTYMDDDRVYFMASPLGGTYGAQWVGDHDIGLGVNAIAWKGPFYVTGGFQDAQDGNNRNYPHFGSLFDGRFVYLAEIGMGRDPGGPDELSVRVTASHLDLEDGDNPSKGPGQSLIVSFLKRHAGQWAIAGRWSRSFKRLSGDYRELGSTALMWLEPFGRSRDLLGVGAFVGDPSDSRKGSEKGLEIFYRMQLTQALNLVPDLQYWNRSDPGSGTTNAWVFGVRLAFAF